MKSGASSGARHSSPWARHRCPATNDLPRPGVRQGDEQERAARSNLQRWKSLVKYFTYALLHKRQQPRKLHTANV